MVDVLHTLYKRRLIIYTYINQYGVHNTKDQGYYLELRDNYIVSHHGYEFDDNWFAN